MVDSGNTSIYNLLIYLIIAVGTSMAATIKYLTGHINKVKEDYVRRDDHRQDMEKLNGTMDKMDAKLDRLIERG